MPEGSATLAAAVVKPRPALPGRVFDAFITALNAFGTALILALMVLICADVIGRSAFNAPLQGVPEMVKALVPVMLWLQVAYTLRIGKHMRSGVGFQLMPRAASRVVLVLNCLVGVFLFGVIAFFAWQEFAMAVETGSFEMGGDVRIPDWPVWLAVFTGALCTGIQYVRDAWRLLRHGPSAVDTGGGEGTE